MAAYTTINDPSAFFQATLYAGDDNNSTAITNTGNSDLQADLIWIKSRTHGNSGTGSHMWFDSSRGIKSTTGSNSPYLSSNSTNGDATNNNGLQAIGSNTFTPGSMTRTNESGDNYVAWQWKANGGTTSTNTAGDINSTVQVNSDAGFSIVTYNPSNTTTRNIGHGLGVKPDCILIRNRTRVENWRMWFNVIGQGALTLDGTAAYTVNSSLVNSATTSVFNIGGDFSVNGNYPYIAYCFAEKQGYSKFGKYTGNGNANGAFVYTGFKPAFVMLKPTAISEQWIMHDGTRDPFNKAYHYLFANGHEAEASGGTHAIDLLSNGFKIRTSNNNWNTTSNIVYMAFAEAPFVTSDDGGSIPTTAR